MRCSLLTLSGYVDEELDARRTGEMEAHLVGCPRCRAGLSHIREEVDRVGGLARVTVPDTSVRALLELLGLLLPGGEMPERAEAALPRVSANAPLPWMDPESGPALPWSAPPRTRRDPSPPSPADGEEPGGPSPAVDTTPLLAPAAAPSRTAEQDARREDADVDVVAALAPPADHLVVPTGDLPVPMIDVVVPATVGSVPIVDVVDPTRDGPGPVAEVAHRIDVLPVATPTVGAPVARPLTMDAAPPMRAVPPGEPQTATTGDAALRDPMRRDRLIAGLVGSLPAPSSQRPSPPPGDTPVAVRLPQSIESLYPIDDEVPVRAAEVAAEPVATAPVTSDMAHDMGHDMAHEAPYHHDEAVDVDPGGPLAAPRPTLIDRFRDRMAMRRALTAGVDDLDGVEVISGLGASGHAPATARDDLARRRSDALRPRAEVEAETTPTRGGRREPGVNELLAPSARPSRAMPGIPVASHPQESGRMELSGGMELRGVVPTAPPAGGREAAPAPRAPATPRTMELPWDADPAPTAPRAGGVREASAELEGLSALRRMAVAPPATAASTSTRRRPSTVDLREGRRLLVLYVAAIATLFVVGLLSARTTTPVPAASTGVAAVPQQPTGSGSAAPAAPAVVGPAVAPGAPAASAPATTAPPAAPSAAPAGPQTAGGTGTGWTVSAVRFGDHGSFYRVVVQLDGGTGAAPAVSAVNQDAQTVVITFSGTQPAGAPITAPGGLVRSMQLVSPPPGPGRTAYRLALSRPATPHIVFASGPLRLVIDLS